MAQSFRGHGLVFSRDAYAYEYDEYDEYDDDDDDDDNDVDDDDDD